LRTFCAEVRRATSEPIFATAPVKARGWLLIQHPGPWPATGLPGDLPPAVHTVAARATAAKIRPQLIRRPADRAPLWPIGIYLGASSYPEPWLQYREFADPDEVAGLIDLLSPAVIEAIAAGDRPGFGTAVDHQVLLVCGHGSRDPCCAKTGRPMAVALAGRYPDLVWESNHLGGHRFAANLVTVPDGSYHGGLDASRGLQVAAATLAGEVDLAAYRGLAGRSAAAQAADWYIRQHTGQVALDAVEVVTERRSEARDGPVIVELRVAGEPIRATVRPVAPRVERLISCATGELDTPEHYELVEITANARVVRRPTAPATAPSAKSPRVARR
jgi:hypothetical protein